MKKTANISKRCKNEFQLIEKQSLFLDRKTKCWERMPILSTFFCRFNIISIKSQQKDKKDKFEMDWGRGFTLRDTDTNHQHI